MHELHSSFTNLAVWGLGKVPRGATGQEACASQSTYSLIKKYVVSQVLNKKYTKAADIWSCGVILYILLCGEPPYPGESARDVMESIRSCSGVTFTSPFWTGISEPAKVNPKP